MNTSTPIIELKDASLQFGQLTLWRKLSMTISNGEFVAVLGPNGSGKSSFLKVLLGQYALVDGTVAVRGTIGYIPQQQTFDVHVPLRARDLVALGVDGDKWGFGSAGVKQRSAINRALKAVDAVGYANMPLGTLSGGQQQRLRVAQAVVSQPSLLLCDEPLLSLDLASQRAVSQLINDQRSNGAAVVFVTHDINPVMQYVDRVLYLVNGKWRLGTPKEILTSEVLSELYGTDVDVLNVRGRLIVVASEGEDNSSHAHHHEELHG